MASMTFKRLTVVATLATSVVLMGGSAFAAGLVPDEASKAHQTVRNTEANVQREIIRPLPL